MKILSLDSSTSSATCAVMEEDKLLGEITFNYKKQHSVILMPIIENLLSSLDLDLDSIDGFVVSKGPGSFTGLRIGLATIKGLSQGTGKPFVAVSSLDALANSMAYTSGIICPIMDALRGNVYTSLYCFEESKLTKLKKDMVVSIEDLITLLKEHGKPVCFIGDGISVHKDKIEKEFKALRFAPPHLNVVKASSLGEIGIKLLKENVHDDIYTFSPQYIRKSQAEREYEKKSEILSHE